MDILKSVMDWLNQFAIFRALVWFLGVYVVVLIIDIILLLATRGLGEDIRKRLYGAVDRPEDSPFVLRSRWKKIEARLAKGSVSEYKVAILEADQLVDVVLAQMGYSGDNLQERISQLLALGIDRAATVNEAHALRNRIIYEPDFSIDRAETERILGLYKEFLEKWEAL